MTAFLFAAIYLAQSLAAVQVQPGTVTGRLLSVDGTPVEGVRIAAVPVDIDAKSAAPALFGISQTDGNGRYRLENIPPGRYYIFAGLIDFPSYYPNATTLDKANSVIVNSGATLSGIDFSMARPAGLIIAGRLAIPSTMLPSDTWTVTLTPMLRDTASTPTTSRISRDGSFEFLRLTPGEYRVSSNLRGSSPVIVSIAETDLRNVVIPVVDCNAGVSVSGRLEGSPRPAVQSIALTGSKAGCSVATTVAPDGSFTFRNVPEGTYQFQLTPVPLGWVATIVNVAKADLTDVGVVLPALISIKGQAIVEDGSAPPGAIRGTFLQIRAVRIGGGEATSSIREDGTFDVALARGQYRITVSDVPSNYYVKSMTAGYSNLLTSYVDVNGMSPPEIQLTLGRIRQPEQDGVRLTGHLSFAATGAQLPAQSVVLVSTSGSRNSVLRTTDVTSDGSFEFTGVPSGIYNLETYPDNPAVLYGIVVNDTDVTGLRFSIPALVKVDGKIEWSGAQGTTVPPARSGLSVQFTRKEGPRMLAWGALSQDGSFHFYLPEGDYRFSVSDVPSGFSLGAVTLADANILEDGLHVRSNSDPPNLRVTLREK